MKRVLLVLVAVVVFALVWWVARGSRKAPDERLAEHTRAMCKIAAGGISDPDDGVRRMFRYYGEQGPTMAKEWAELLVTIERIDDDDAHDARARLASRRLRAPAIACAQTFQRFGDAIERSPEASARVERGVERFSRTLEILFGEDGGAVLTAPFGGVDGMNALDHALDGLEHRPSPRD
ncbi:MAG TPA: hypothetical protein VHE35_03735 [Kofleriaceae bacterium]|nr:hypothetical protein [Kofleriaceae bacterium]